MNLRDKLGGLSRVELAVVVSGVVSMGLEILAGRVVAPEFGSSIYTWGSIIGVSMLALSLGYHYGGKTSNKANFKDLEKFLVLTAGYILFVMVFGSNILTETSLLPLPSIYSSIPAITLLFGPPTYFLGYISPYAAQLSNKETKGEASGHFYAIGTAGSIIGAFGTTFILIPNLPVNWIYTLFATLTTIPLIHKLNEPKTYLPIIILLTAALVIQGPSLGDNVIYQDKTQYQASK
jgi:hypothetical protein